jgi:alpha-beta hydrolase superfamily lysophospholipase
MRRDFRLDVTSATPAHVGDGRPQWLGARLVAPSAIDAGGAVPVVVCVHGGGFDKRYYDMQIPGLTDYSMAEHFARRGAVVVALDYIGIGDSSRPAHPSLIDRRVFAALQHAAAAQVFKRASAGELAPGLPPLSRIRRVGMAHSMGVMLTVTQQVEHSTYDQVALLGYSVRGVRLTRVIPSTSPAAAAGQDYEVVQRVNLRPEYYMPDVPAGVIAADEAAGAPAPVTISREATAGNPSVDADRFTAPLFFALGEHDISPHPHEEVGMFSACDDITFMIVAGAAHSLNLASTRTVLWDRMLAWIPTVPQA